MEKCVASCTFVSTNILRTSGPKSLLASKAGIILATRIIYIMEKKNIPVQGEIKGGRVRTLQTKGIWLSVNEWHDP